jgi:glycosyltransferase involved in cell wall biosynthesis
MWPTRLHLAEANVFVVPLLTGEGMRVKILDAWLWGLPVVSTPIGAEGIEIQAGASILIAADAGAFAEATCRLLTDQALNQQLRSAARSWVESRYAWQPVYQQVEQVYVRLLDGNTPDTTRGSFSPGQSPGLGSLHGLIGLA